MKRPDKYPAVDPRLPRLYDRILEAAKLMRQARHAENVANWAVVRAQRIASLAPLALREREDEILFPTLSPSGGISGPVPAVAASEDQT